MRSFNWPTEMTDMSSTAVGKPEASVALGSGVGIGAGAVAAAIPALAGDSTAAGEALEVGAFVDETDAVGECAAKFEHAVTTAASTTRAAVLLCRLPPLLPTDRVISSRPVRVGQFQ